MPTPFPRLSKRLAHLALILVSLGGASSAYAQDSTGSSPRIIPVQLFYWQESNSSYMMTADNMDEKREKRFLKPVTLWYSAEDQFKRVRVRAGQRSPVITIPAGDDIVLYRNDPTGLEAIPESDVIRIPVEFNVKRGLILMRGVDPSLQMTLIDVSDSRLPRGTIRMVNYAPRQVAAKVGEKIVPVPFGDSAMIRLREDDTPRLNLMIAEREEANEWKIFYSTVLSVGADNRMLIMVYPNPENHDDLKVKILSIPG